MKVKPMEIKTMITCWPNDAEKGEKPIGSMNMNS